MTINSGKIDEIIAKEHMLSLYEAANMIVGRSLSAEEIEYFKEKIGCWEELEKSVLFTIKEIYKITDPAVTEELLKEIVFETSCVLRNLTKTTFATYDTLHSITIQVIHKYLDRNKDER